MFFEFGAPDGTGLDSLASYEVPIADLTDCVYALPQGFHC
jgi:hypothetical protein